MSSLNYSGENEFALEELNIVEISENSAQIEDKRILKSIKKGIIEKEEDEKEFSISFSK
ncbi:MAG TPA: hypothetical protein VJU13_03730 [Candidatus Nitrosocosmicus sp.]|nr:hypothetical protein [Candidatus Nitrosocosmicus sp.]